MISRLHSYTISVLSGDNDSEKLNLAKIFPRSTNIHFNQSPEDKLEFIRESQANNRKVLMFGDGLNDAGAIKQSDVGVVLSEDVNNFSPSCDAILDAGSFTMFPALLRFSKIAIRLIWVAFGISFLYNLVGLSFAVSGNLSPVVAAILMPISSISVVIFATLSTRIVARLML